MKKQLITAIILLNMYTPNYGSSALTKSARPTMQLAVNNLINTLNAPTGALVAQSIPAATLPNYPKYRATTNQFKPMQFQQRSYEYDAGSTSTESGSNYSADQMRAELKNMTFSMPSSYQKSQIHNSSFNQQKRSFATISNTNKQELAAISWHEAGHAASVVYNFSHQILAKVTIQPGSNYGGYAQYTDIRSKKSIDRANLLNTLDRPALNQPLILDPRYITNSHTTLFEDQLPLSLENKIITCFAGAIAEYKYKTQHNLISPLSDITYYAINSNSFKMPFNIDTFEKFVQLSKSQYLGAGQSFIENTDLGQAYSFISQYLNVPYESLQREQMKNPLKETIFIPDTPFDPNNPVNKVLSKIYTKAYNFIDTYEPEIAKVAELLLKETAIHGDDVYDILQTHKPLFDDESGPLPEKLVDQYAHRGYSNPYGYDAQGNYVGEGGYRDKNGNLQEVD